MSLIPNAGAVLRRAWSAWAFYALILIQTIPEAIEAAGLGETLSPDQRLILTVAVALAGVGLRVIRQNSLSGEAPS